MQWRVTNSKSVGLRTKGGKGGIFHEKNYIFMFFTANYPQSKIKKSNCATFVTSFFVNFMKNTICMVCP
jgi:hypothetical protein